MALRTSYNKNARTMTGSEWHEISFKHGYREVDIVARKVWQQQVTQRPSFLTP
jgi:hypothetical protein